MASLGATLHPGRSLCARSCKVMGGALIYVCNVKNYGRDDRDAQCGDCVLWCDICAFVSSRARVSLSCHGYRE